MAKDEKGSWANAGKRRRRRVLADEVEEVGGARTRTTLPSPEGTGMLFSVQCETPKDCKQVSDII